MKNRTPLAALADLSPTERDEIVGLFSARRYREMEHRARLLVEQHPQSGFAWKSLGTALQMQDRADLAVLRQVVKFSASDAEAHSNLGRALQDAGQVVEAIAAYRRAIELNPDFAEAHFNLGGALKGSGQLHAAVASFCSALKISPDFADAHYNLANSYKELGQFADALASYRRALEVKPDFLKAQSNLLHTLNFTDCSPPLFLAEAKSYGRMVAAKANSRISSWQCSDHHGILKVGFVSGDLRSHPVGFFIESVLSNLNRDKVALFAYPTQAVTDDVTERLRKEFISWKPIFGLNDEAAAQSIHDDGIDILFDLSGHTGYNRLPLFARKPAPVQVSWLGFLGTCGVAEVDYLLGDPYATPLTDDGNYSETVWRMPESYCCFTAPNFSVPINQLPAAKAGFITFGSFNNLAKMTDAVVALWARILHKLPRARLLLKTRQLNEPATRKECLRRFAAHGIDAKRLLLEGPAPRAELIATYNKIDIALDPFPYTGATTSVEALWMGVPVLTLKGDRFIARCGESINHNGGLDDWIATDAEDYVARAVAHASDVPKLAALRGRLRQQVLASPIFDAPRFARNFEEALRGMWLRYRDSRSRGDDAAGGGDESVIGGTLLESTASRQHQLASGAIDLSPSERQALTALYGAGRHAELEVQTRALLEQYPTSGFAYKVLGACLQAQGKEALPILQRAAALLPDDAQAQTNLGIIQETLKQVSDAVASYRKAIAANSDYAEAHSNLAHALTTLGRLDEAIESAKRALMLAPDLAEAHCNLGDALRDAGALSAAVDSYRRAIEIAPTFAKAHNNLGSVLKDLEQFGEAEIQFRRAVELDPEYALAHDNLGRTLQGMGQIDRAVASYRRALEIRPDYVEALGNMLFAHNYSSDQDEALLLAEARRFGDLVKQAARPYTAWRTQERDAKCLRVGFVSGDLRDHPVGRFLESVLASIDPEKIELFAYPTYIADDAVSARLRPFFRQWKSVAGLNDEAAAALIHADGVQVLIDLSGHTAKNLLSVFAWKPAPVQVTWLGYFATTGVAAIDYLIADRWTLPESEEVNFTEKIWRLPATRLCFTVPDMVVDVSRLPALKNGYLTFGCFNHLSKVSDQVVELWAALLQRIPNSRLFLKSAQLADHNTIKSTIGRFEALGISRGRLTLERTSPRAEYLAAYQRVDIALDPFPYPGGTTTVECLWMGVPVLTLAGQRFLSRQGVGLLMNAGLEDWIAVDADDYVARAVAHASDLPKLAALRGRLRQQVLASPIFDAPRFARNFEEALRGMWERFLDSRIATPRGGFLGVHSRSNDDTASLIAGDSERLIADGNNGPSGLDLPDDEALGGMRADSTASRQHQLANQAVDLSPGDCQALSALYGAGRHAELEAKILGLLEQYPTSGFAYKVLGACLQAQGKQALPTLQKAADLLPADAQAQTNLGMAFSTLGRLNEAVASYRLALVAKPDSAIAHCHLGAALTTLGVLDEAEASCRRALAIDPDLAQGHSNLGSVLQDIGHLNASIASYRRALEIEPGMAKVHNNLGVAMQDSGLPEGAVESYRKALKIKPDYAIAHNNLGISLKHLGQIEQAVASYRRALAIKPDYSEAYCNLGNALKTVARYDDAIMNFGRALELKPDYPEALSNLGTVFEDLGRIEDALASYERALEIQPGYTMAHNNLLFIRSYMVEQTGEGLLAEAMRFGQVVAQKARPFAAWQCVPDRARRLRVGFVSGDLRNHSVGHFVEGILAALASGFADRLEIIAYATHFQADAVTARIKASCHSWHSVVGLSDEKSARRIHDDNIDILIDLSGHTAHNRLGIFAWKPAPVQVSWLGYFATTGVAAIDYLLADPWTLQKSEESRFTEEIWRLPETRLCFTPPDTVLEVSPLPTLSEGRITFGCFNNLTKITDEVVAIWARILAKVAGSRLFLKTKQLGEASVRAKVIERFGACGIDGSRLILEGSSPVREYFAAYHRVDIALDPFPYPGGTITAQSLWMGVPVLTMTGKRFLSRQGVGLLMNAGLDDWIATDADDYVARAVAHASDLPKLAALRGRLRQQVLASPIFDAPRFARNFEAALRGMWVRFLDSRFRGNDGEGSRNYGEGSGNDDSASPIVGDSGRSIADGRNDASGLDLPDDEARGGARADSTASHQHQLANQAVDLSPGDRQALIALYGAGRHAELEAKILGLLDQYPTSGFAYKVLGACLQAQGKEALPALQTAAELLPADAQTQNNLGIAQEKLEYLADAVASYRKAIAANPDYAEAHSNLAHALTALGLLGEAIDSAKRALVLAPDLAEAHCNLGDALRDTEAYDEAVASYRRAIELAPNFAKAHNNLAAVLQKLGRFAEAVEACGRAIEINPNYAAAHHGLGNALQRLEQYSEAISSYQRALELNPRDAAAYCDLGMGALALGQLGKAQKCCQRAVEIDPDFAKAHCNLGVVLQALGLHEASVASFRRALAIEPDDAGTYMNMGNAFKGLRQLEDATSSYARSVALDPTNAQAHSNLGTALQDLGRIDEALACYRKALEIEPACLGAHNNLLFIRNYMVDQAAELLLAEAMRFGEVVAQTARPFSAWQCVRDPAKRLRVGFVSGDLRNHSVGHFLEGILAALAQGFADRMEIIAYPTHFQVDAVADRIKASCRAWHSAVGLSDQAFAQRIHDDKIDILIDLSGHTGHNRLGVFAWKPAPVQATWLGYLATTGVAAMDYLIADAWTLPASEESRFVEHVWRLPNSYVCFTPPSPEIDVSPLPALATGAVTFGSLNNLTKVTDDVVVLWSRILQAIPGSRLLFKVKQSKEESVHNSILKRFAVHGIDSSRLILEGHVRERAKYLESYQHIDIALDPFPYPGITTTVESLWMGVPVLALAGERFLSRQGVGLLMNAGLPDWIATDADNYVARVVAHASDLPKLATLRGRLRQQVLASPIFDAPRFARNFEEALRGMWQRFLNSGGVIAPEGFQSVLCQENDGHPSGKDNLDSSINSDSGCLVAEEDGEANGTDLSGGKAVVGALANSTASHQHQLTNLATDLPQSERHTLVELFKSGRLLALETQASALLERYPGSGFVYKLLGACLLSQGKDALPTLQKAAELLPHDPAAQTNLGIAQEGNGDFVGAIASYRGAIAIAPLHFEAHSNLAHALTMLGRLDEALAACFRAIEIDPNSAVMFNRLGMVMKGLGRLDEAETSYRRALAIKPDFAEVYNNLGTVMKGLGRPDEAETSYRHALTLKPDFAEAHNNLGALMKHLGRLDEAAMSYRRALAVNPGYAFAHNNLGNVMRDLGQFGHALTSYRRALEIKPDFAEAFSNQLFALTHDQATTPENIFSQHKVFSERYELSQGNRILAHSNSRAPLRRLRLGFVSGDLRDHAVAHFIEPVWAALNTAEVEIFVYSNHPREDAVTRRLRKLSQHWENVVGRSDADLAGKIRSDAVDVLFDLSGHTANNRLLVFASKPAPIQVTWIGYPNTTGLIAMDYVLADRFNAPIGLYEHCYVEKFARLPSSGTFLPAAIAPEVNVLPMLGRGYAVFGSFNRVNKLGAKVVGVWSRVMLAVPNARLLLANVSDAAVAKHLTDVFGQHGIAAERLDFRPRLGLRDYLALHHEVDICLDTWPYTGGTTTNHALWMGVPVVTLQGPSRANCQSAAVLARLDLQGWVAHDEDEFVRLAVRWARQPEALAILRAGMRERWRVSPRRQPATVARGLELAVRSMWQRWCAGLPAENFEISDEAVFGAQESK